MERHGSSSCASSRTGNGLDRPILFDLCKKNGVRLAMAANVMNPLFWYSHFSLFILGCLPPLLQWFVYIPLVSCAHIFGRVIGNGRLSTTTNFSLHIGKAGAPSSSESLFNCHWMCTYALCTRITLA